MKTSVAYDLAQFAPSVERQPRVEVVRTQKKKNKTKKALKARLITYVIMLTVLMMGTVYSRIQLTEVRSDINKKNTELTKIESENAYLNYEMESMVSLKNAEEYAVDELGLVKLDSNQIEYVTLRDENQIITEDSSDENSFTRFINSVIEFFSG